MIMRLAASLVMLVLVVGSAHAAVDANTASVDTLQTVRGIGPSIAARIVAERARGPYRSLDDLQARVRGVGEASVRRMAAKGLTVGTGNSAGTAPSVGAVRDTRPATKRVTDRDTAAPKSPATVPAPERAGPRPRHDTKSAAEARS
jgi:competence protein ComEA